MSEPATAAGMYTLVVVALAPCITGDGLSAEVAEVVRFIRDSGLPNRTTSMFTEIEGDWDEVMQVVRDATFVLASKGIRTEVVLKADIRPGFTDTMTGKLERMEAQIKKQEEARGASATTLISRPIWYSAPKTRSGVPWAMWWPRRSTQALPASRCAPRWQVPARSSR